MARNDFTNDGVSDLVWRKGDQVGLWDMAAGGIPSYVIVGQASTDWTIVGSGDYNGNGTDDLLFRQAGTGSVGYWNIVDGVNTGFVPLIWETSSAWSIVKTQGADFNGDGRDDILWRNANGDLGIYRMTGSGAFDFAWDVLGNVSNDWKVLGADDFNGDGRADILWRNSDSGQVGYYAMNGGVQGWVGLGTATSEWFFQGTADFDGDHFADILWERIVASKYDNLGFGSTTSQSGYWDINDGVLGGFSGSRVYTSSSSGFRSGSNSSDGGAFGDYTGDGSEDTVNNSQSYGTAGSFVPSFYSSQTLRLLDYENGLPMTSNVGDRFNIVPSSDNGWILIL